MSTTKAKTATKKATTTKKASATTAPKIATKAAVPATAATPVVVDSPQPVISGPMMRKKELIDLVVERSGIKKKDAKPVVEAVLAVLGEAIGESRELNLQPMGKLRVRRVKEMPNGRVMVTKIRQSSATTAANADSADAAPALNTVPDAAE
ncbi:MAG: nucleoid DNA-binding protein [Ascidiaceihabitans sp.]|jgi:nucleoid DNA-binding protein